MIRYEIRILRPNAKPFLVSTTMAGDFYALKRARALAVLLDLSRGNAYRYVREGVIPAKRVGRRWMVPRKSFHAWLESCEAGDI